MDNQTNDVCAEWINDLLKEISRSGNDELKSILRGCGRACAVRRGFLSGMTALRKAASDCKTREDYVGFLQSHLPGCKVEEDDGIVIHLNKTQCGCPMHPRVHNPALCECTAGNNQATWSEFFGHDVRVEVIESFLRGGNDCVLKIFI